MVEVINIHTGKKRIIKTFNCSICNSTFTEDEGGMDNGMIGILPVSFCPTCFSGILNMAEYFMDKSDEKEEEKEDI